MDNENKRPMVVEHEKYSIDLFNYQIALWLGNEERLSKLPSNRFSGRRVQGDSKRRKAILKRDRRLQKYGMSVVLFAS